MSHAIGPHLQEIHRALPGEVKRFEQRNIHGDYSGYRKAKTTFEEPIIPDPIVFDSLESPGSSQLDIDLPSAAQCAVHLELLEVFYALRVNIINSAALDKTFGIELRHKTVYQDTWNSQKRKYVKKEVKLKDTTWETRRREKWDFFLGLAAGRFRFWMKAADQAMASQATLGQMTLPALPPLDVLMVWHALLLNPKDYERFVKERNLKCVGFVPFPWTSIHAAIDRRTWSLNFPPEARIWAENTAKIESDLFTYLTTVGTTSSPLSSILIKFGELNPTPLSLSEALASDDLTATERVLLECVQMVDKQKALSSLASAGTARSSMTRLRITTGTAAATKDLVANVQRQAAFVDKMHKHLWIHSPALRGTLRRAVDRYSKFLGLFRLYPGSMLVPTSDIDLAWHTHQCSASLYRESMTQRARRFINHDDKLGRGVLGNGMKETRDLFTTRFGSRYEICLCWDCEAVLSALEQTEKGGLYEGWADSAVLEEVKNEVEYYRCVELAVRKGSGLLPVRVLSLKTPRLGLSN